MRRVLATSVLVVAGLFVTACSDQRSPLPTEPPLSPSLTGRSCPSPLQLAALTLALFTPGDLLTFARSTQNTISLKMSRGDIAGARKAALAFVDFALKSYYQGKLRDPNGNNPPTTAEAVVTLIDGILCWVGLPPSGLQLVTTGGDVTVTTKVIGPGGDQFKSTDELSGLKVPPGAVSEDRLWVITRRDDLANAGTCVSTTLRSQIPLCIDFSVVPAQDVARPLVVAICQPELNQPPDRRLAHKLADAKIELLAVTVDPFPLVCTSTPDFHPPGLGRVARAVWKVGSFMAQVLGPKRLHATHSGLGGLLGPKLSPVTAVRVRLNFEVQPTNTAPGHAITPAVQVAFRDFETEAVATEITNRIQLTIGLDPNEGGSTLAGTTTQTPTGGVATFADLSINRTGVGFTLVSDALSSSFTGDSLIHIPGTSNAFDIQAPFLFRATFANDAPDAPPGAPDVGSWSLTSPAGTILVRAISGNLTNQPVELDHFLTGVAGSVKLRGTVAGTPPGTGRYLASWRSLVHSADACFNGIALRDANNLILASVEYRPSGQLTYNSNRVGGPITVGSWAQDVAQLFEITVDLDNHVTSLSINSTSVAAAQGLPYPDPTGTAANLAQINMELGCVAPPQQTYAWDDIVITRAP